MPAQPLPDAALFKVEVVVPVRWGDMDALGHVNNATYFTYFESARIAYFERVQAFEGYEHAGTGPILANTSCDFLVPVAYPATLVCGVRTTKIGNTSFHMQYLLRDQASGRAHATGTAVTVMFDYKAQKTIAVSDALKARIRAIDGAV